MTTRIEHQAPEIDFSTFPDSDGLPVAENEINLQQMLDLILQLRQALGPRGDHVGGNLLIYYDPADGRRHVSPDVYVALESGSAPRKSWKTWEEGKFPEVVFEISSPGTSREDIGSKVRLYGDLGAREYYVFDPAGDIDPAYGGYQSRGGRLVPMSNPSGMSIISPTLGLELRVMNGSLRLIDPRTGGSFPLPADAMERVEREALARRAAEARADAAEVRAQAAEAEAVRLRALLERVAPPDP